MSRQWFRRFGTERPGAASAPSAFAPRPFAAKPSLPVTQREAAEEKPEEPVVRERPPVTPPWSIEPPLQAKPAPLQEPAEILPIEGFSPSETRLQFTLKDARQWVKANGARSGYPDGWNRIPRKQQIEEYIEAKKAGWNELQTAYEKAAEVGDAVPREASEASFERSRKPKRKEPPHRGRELEALAVPRKKERGKAEAEDEDAEVEIEEEEEEKPGGEVATVRQIFLDVMRDLRVGDDLSKAIVVDLDLSRYSASALQFLRLSSHKEIASCFDTAKRLFELVGDPASDASNSWDAAGPMRTALPQLIRDIRAHKDSSCIYRCGIAGVAHGFTIILQGGRGDVVQGFAGAGGESLAENLESGKTGYTIEELIGHLNHLLDRNADRTLQAQNELFAGSVDIEKIRRDDEEALEKARDNEDLTEGHADDQTDPVYLYFYRDLRKDSFQFERRGLYSQEQLRERITAKVTENLRILNRRR